jgi:hypothetical protein
VCEWQSRAEKRTEMKQKGRKKPVLCAVLLFFMLPKLLHPFSIVWWFCD